MRYSFNTFDSELASLLSFYGLIILGLDAGFFASYGGKEFASYGGKEFFEKVNQVSELAMQNGGVTGVLMGEINCVML